jgi:haloalkane dehalogenase
MHALPPSLQVLYPFTGRRHPTAGGDLHYLDEGAGEAVVMFHGNPTWSFLYRDLILYLRGHYRCLAPDHLGCGLSDKPRRADYSLAGHIRRSVEWLEARGTGPFHLVVHDWGGPIGLGVADALRDRVRSISIFNTAAFPFPSIPLRIAACRVPLAGPLLVRGANAFVEAATRMTTTRPLPDAVRDGYRLPYGSWSDRVAIDAFVRDIPMRRGHRSRATLEAVAASLGQWRGTPLQLVWGMRDWCFHPGILAEWRRRFPDAPVHRLEDAGHYLMEDAGDRVLPLVRGFIDAHAAR